MAIRVVLGSLGNRAGAKWAPDFRLWVIICSLSGPLKTVVVDFVADG